LQSQIIADLNKEKDDEQYEIYNNEYYVIEEITANVLDIELGNIYIYYLYL
jgi:hypothetical protein